jgi:hypothetical protein
VTIGGSNSIDAGPTSAEQASPYPAVGVGPQRYIDPHTGALIAPGALPPSPNMAQTVAPTSAEPQGDMSGQPLGNAISQATQGAGTPELQFIQMLMKTMGLKSSADAKQNAEQAPGTATPAQQRP